MLEEVDVTQFQEPAAAPPSTLRRLALRRLSLSRSLARELGSIAFNIAVWPVGLVDEQVARAARRIRRPNQINGNGRRPSPGSAAAEVPIILIHGYFHNRSGFLVMQRALRKHGFCNVFAFTYNPLGKGIPEIASKVGCRVEEILTETGAEKVHLVGHSLGGLLARYYAESLGGHDRVHTIVTLGTPHSGTLTAYAGRSPTARQMRPGSEFLSKMAAAARPPDIRYISYYSNLDALVVPSESAILDEDRGNITNVGVHDLGHLSLLINQKLADSIAANLSDVSGSATPSDTRS